MFTTPHRNYKLPGLPHLRVSVNEEHLPFAVQDAHLHTERPVENSLQSEKPFDIPVTSQALSHPLYHQNQRSASPSFKTRIDRTDLATGFPMAEGAILPRKWFPSKHGNKASSSPSRSLYVGAKTRSTKGANALSPMKTLNNLVHTDTTCRPRCYIFFLKTHKTASSTILNILYRYGESRNLTFALPLNKHSQLFYPYFFASHFVEGVSSRSVKEFNIMCNHMRFRKSEVSSGTGLTDILLINKLVPSQMQKRT